MLRKVGRWSMNNKTRMIKNRSAEKTACPTKKRMLMETKTAIKKNIWEFSSAQRHNIYSTPR